MGWDDRKRQLSVRHWFGSCGVFSMLFLLFARLGRGEYLIGLRASVEYYGVSSRGQGKTWGNGQVKKETRIQQHGEELIDVCFMDMADRSNCR
jgi:hypothetical protein